MNKSRPTQNSNNVPVTVLSEYSDVVSHSSMVSPSPQWSNANNMAPDNVSVTGSEAEFMLRHAETGDFSHNDPSPLKLTGSVRGAATNDNEVDNSALGSKLMDSMRKRIASLESEVSNLATKLSTKEVELERMDDKYKKVHNEKISLSNHSNKELARIKEEHEREILQVKSDFSVKLSNLVSDPDALAEAASNSSPGAAATMASTRKSLTQESSIQATSVLIERLDELRNELKVQSENFAAERKKLSADHSLKLINTERSFKVELQEQRSLTAALEDKLKDTEDELAEVRSRERTSRVLCSQLESKYKESVEAQTKLKNDLKIMQTSIGNTYKLESAQEIGVGVDADTAIRLAEAKSEAKIRQIQIKCDFMRSQLEAEHVAQEELNKTIETMKNDYDVLKNDFRTRVREMETEKQQAIEDTERKTELHFEERMLELSALQSKFHMLQGQLQESLQDNSLSKQREEAAKANALKAQAQQANLRAELEHTKNSLEDLRTQKEEGATKESTQKSNEALLRRLDNERTYLKNQLSSEMTHKNELQGALRQCQQQLADQQRQWTDDVDSLKATLTQKEEDSTLQEQKMSLRISALEGEEARLKVQNTDLREGFKKMRDQLRVEELNMENIRTANRRLLEEVESCRGEIIRLKREEESANMISQQQTTAMAGSLSALEEKSAAEAAHLRSELSKQYVANADSQRALLDLKGAFESERVQLEKKLNAGRILHSMRHMYKNRVAASFRLWYNQSMLLSAASQFKETLKNAVLRTQEEDRKDAENALSQLRKELSEEWNSRLNLASQHDEERLENALQEAEERRLISLDELRTEMEEMIRSREADWQSRYDDSEGWTKSLLDEEARKMENLVTMYEKRADEEKARRDEEEVEKIESARQVALAEAETIWSKERDQLELEHQVHAERSLRVVEEAHLNKIKAIKEKHEEDKVVLAAELEEKHDAKLIELEKKHELDKEMMQGVHMDEIHDLMGTAQVKHEKQMAEQKDELQLQHEIRIRELREFWAEELKIKMEEYDIEMTRQFNEKAEKLDHSVESERKKAEALEAAKWRQALKDAEKRYKLDLQQVRAQAWSERDQEAKLELAGVVADNERQRQSIKDKHAEELEEIKLSFSNKIENMSSEFEVDKVEAVRVAVVNATAELNEKWEKEFASKILLVEKTAQQQWSLKYNKEKELTEKLRGDIAKQAQSHAEERNTLQDKINGNDEILKRLEEDHKMEIKRFEREHERALDNLDIRFQNSKKLWSEEEKKREEENLANAKAVWEAELNQKIKQVKTDMETDMEIEMSKVKEESDQLVTGLESAVNNIRMEKTSLAEEIERASERLEELEDAQFDLQQELKLKAKEMSFALWKICTGAMNMKVVFKQVMEDAQAKTSSLLDSTKETLTRKVEKVTLLGLRLSDLLAQSENSRKAMNEALTQYKSSALVEKRAQIRMTELELERMGSDRDVMEDERNSQLDQIAGQGGLEDQVSEIEEQMRDHANSSTVMQNGRINVAHAKKKKRLDNELERLLELIEEKKTQVASLEEREISLQTRREEKEVVLIDLEKELVQILIDQQRLVLNLVEDGKLTEEKAKHVAHQYNFPWPPIENPTIGHAKELFSAL